MFCIGLARYSSRVPVAPDVPPVIVSPVINFCWEETNIFEPRESSTRTVAVAPEVAPVIVSLFVNLPVVPLEPLSVTTRSPSSSY